ncbi:MAG TPA: hypothetical protein VJH63_00475 [Candidatus Paceibacterota bacterium]
MFFLVLLPKPKRWSLIVGPPIDEVMPNCISVPETEETRCFERLIKAMPGEHLLGAISTVIHAQEYDLEKHDSEEVKRFRDILVALPHDEPLLLEAITQIVRVAINVTPHRR